MKTFDIAIAGELNLDLILYGLPTEMPLERELLASGFHATLGSSSAIVAHNASSLGARVCFASLIGSDNFGRIALERLQSAGVNTSRTVVHKDIQTGVTILLPHGEERHILTYAGTISEMTVAGLDVDFLMQAHHFHLSSLYLQRGLHHGLPELLRRLKQAGLTVSLDTNDDPEDSWGYPLLEILHFVDVFLPSESEICRMSGALDLDDAIRAFAGRVPTIVVKRGRRGARSFQNGVATDFPPLNVVPKDTIGAGDSFDAGFLRAYVNSRDISVCARAGNIAGALSTQGSGGTEAFANHDQRLAFLTEHKFFELIAD
jgi:sugar/nucleoside kinase (ribokinase family)